MGLQTHFDPNVVPTATGSSAWYIFLGCRLFSVSDSIFVWLKIGLPARGSAWFGWFMYYLELHRINSDLTIKANFFELRCLLCKSFHEFLHASSVKMKTKLDAKAWFDFKAHGRTMVGIGNEIRKNFGAKVREAKEAA